MQTIQCLHNDIYEIQNFITEEECQEVLNIANSLKEEDWWQNDEASMEFSWWNGRQYLTDHLTLFNNISNKVFELFDQKLAMTGLALQRYNVGDNIGQHTDYWKHDIDYHIRYGIVIYYNDNYEGGEIEYPNLGITHKPKKGSLIIHGGNILHGTLPVTEGIRYFSTCFIKGSKETPVILNKVMFDSIKKDDGSVYD